MKYSPEQAMSVGAADRVFSRASGDDRVLRLFDQIQIEETHRVHEHAGSAIVRARRLP